MDETVSKMRELERVFRFTGIRHTSHLNIGNNLKLVWSWLQRSLSTSQRKGLGFSSALKTVPIQHKPEIH